MDTAIDALVHDVGCDRADACKLVGRSRASHYRVGWRGGASPPRSRQTGREPLDSSGFLPVRDCCGSSLLPA